MKEEILIVDGYNMIGSWPELNRLKQKNQIEEARDLLLEEISDYAAFHGIDAWVIFDAMYVPGLSQSFEKYNCHVVFTAEGETADSYIEGMIKEQRGVLRNVTVATSDLAEQRVVFHQGAIRQSARELKRDIELTKQQIKNGIQDTDRDMLPTTTRRIPWTHAQLKELHDLLDRLSDKKSGK